MFHWWTWGLWGLWLQPKLFLVPKSLKPNAKIVITLYARLDHRRTSPKSPLSTPAPKRLQNPHILGPLHDFLMAILVVLSFPANSPSFGGFLGFGKMDDNTGIFYSHGPLYSTRMAAHRLKNYLRTYRKRAGFTQREMASLLGAHAGSKVSRYERFSQRPSLPVVFAYEVIFVTSACKLLGETCDEVRRATLKRIQSLHKRLGAGPPDRFTAGKIEALQAALEQLKSDSISIS